MTHRPTVRLLPATRRLPCLAAAALALAAAWVAAGVPAAAQDYVLVDALGNDISIEPGDAEAATPSAFPWLRLQDLAATRDKPLFVPDRSPPPKAAEPQPEPEPEAPPEEPEVAEDPPHVRLAGVVTNGTLSVAMIVDADTEEVVQVKPGQSVSDWVLVAVEPRAVRLKRGDQEVRVPLSAEVAGAGAADEGDDAADR